MDDAAREEIKNTVAKKMQERQLKDREEQATKNKTEGAKFLEDNAKREGVKTTASGLQYEVLTEGKGSHPKARSEEHTSELQSLMRISYAVFCLKKKKRIYNITHRHCQNQKLPI